MPLLWGPKPGRSRRGRSLRLERKVVRRQAQGAGQEPESLFLAIFVIFLRREGPRHSCTSAKAVGGNGG